MLISPKCSVSVILATHNCLKNQSDVDARAHWGLVSAVLDGDDNNPWPRTWMLDVLPTTWFPRCRRHLGPRGAGPRTVYTIAVQDADCRIQLATHGSMRIDLVECENASCLEGTTGRMRKHVNDGQPSWRSWTPCYSQAVGPPTWTFQCFRHGMTV